MKVKKLQSAASHTKVEIGLVKKDPLKQSGPACGPHF